ncbi:hypothetical protein HYT84_02565 [Candidatus Micrarchaeota archaeon]|nr:hypothetical protein [Candidatus Micrarchaeota archaeon]
MDDLFAKISDLVEASVTTVAAVHHAVTDLVIKLDITLAEYTDRLNRGEARFSPAEAVTERIGGGGINAALVAASLGFKGIHFVGFFGERERTLIEQITASQGVSLDLAYLLMNSSGVNVVIELKDANIVHPISPHHNGATRGFLSKLSSVEHLDRGWVACCSFYPEIVFPLIASGLTTSLFLDTGYHDGKRKAELLTAFIGRLRDTSISELILAANGAELQNIGSELGLATFSNLFEIGFNASKKLSRSVGKIVSIIVHTGEFAAFFDPTMEGYSLVPTFEIEPRRRTNAGDRFTGAFLGALVATGNPELAIFYANAATAKTLRDDVLPTRETTLDFLRTAKLRDVRISGVKTLGLAELKVQLSNR